MTSPSGSSRASFPSKTSGQSTCLRALSKASIIPIYRTVKSARPEDGPSGCRSARGCRYFIIRQFPVLGRERVDGRHDEPLRYAQGLFDKQFQALSNSAARRVPAGRSSLTVQPSWLEPSRCSRSNAALCDRRKAAAGQRPRSLGVSSLDFACDAQTCSNPSYNRRDPWLVSATSPLVGRPQRSRITVVRCRGA
jgi:hypothetical protein